MNMRPIPIKIYPSMKTISVLSSESIGQMRSSIDLKFTIVYYLAKIISDRAHMGKKKNAKIDFPKPLQIIRVVRNFTSPLIVPQTYYALILRFLSCILREIIMVSFERTTDLITSPNRRRKSAAFFRALSEKYRNAIVNFFLA